MTNGSDITTLEPPEAATAAGAPDTAAAGQPHPAGAGQHPDPAAEQPLSESAARLRLAIVRMARRLRQEASGAVGELTPTAVSALSTVSRHGPLTPSELAEIERVKRPTATRTLSALTEAGLVVRSPDPADRRSALVSITPAGQDHLRRLRRRKNAYLAKRMRRLSDADVATLERAATILEDLLEDAP